MQDDLVGKTLGRYPILSCIAQGGMAIVYLGWHPTLNQHVAVKVLLPAYAQNREFVTRFQREALAAARLRHPNIIHIYDAGQADGHYFIVMEYIEGGSLQDRLQQLAARGKRLDVATSLNIARQIADALDYAHRHGIIHRDVKPSNILLTKEGQAILTDLGIAKAAASAGLTKTMMGMGTAEYISPEQGEGEKVDHRTDIYALGVVLYEMLAGRTPFQADTPWAVIYQHVHNTPPPLGLATPPQIQGIVHKAMAKKPRDRYRTAAEMRRALDEAMGVPSPPPPGPAMGIPALIGALAVVLVILGTVLARSHLGQSPTTTPTVSVTITIVMPTQTSVPMLPTSTLRPTSTPAPRRATPTSTRVPPTRTPTRRPATATPMPSPTQVAYPAPTLLGPPDGSQFGKGNIVLQWQWPGHLGPDEWFDVRVWREGRPHQGIAWAKGTTHAIDPRPWPGATYYWSIAVIRGRNGKWEADLSPESAVWRFTWGGGAQPPQPPSQPPSPLR